MNNEKLVSIISPCYNGEQYVARFFESILNQSYKKLELIFVNDGSTDKTEEIALSYEKKLKDSGIEYHYIYQENFWTGCGIKSRIGNFSGRLFDLG